LQKILLEFTDSRETISILRSTAVLQIAGNIVLQNPCPSGQDNQ